MAFFCTKCYCNIQEKNFRFKCRQHNCAYNTNPISYEALIKEINTVITRLLESKRTYESHPLIRNLASCTHIQYGYWPYRPINTLCMYCIKCPIDQSPLDLICPVCGMDLNFTFYIGPFAKIIPVFGGDHSGKTTLLASLLHVQDFSGEGLPAIPSTLGLEGRAYITENFGRIKNNSQNQSFACSPPIYLRSNNDYHLFFEIPAPWMINPDQLAYLTPLYQERPVVMLLVDPYSLSSIMNMLPPLPKNIHDEILEVDAIKILYHLITAYENTGVLSDDEKVPSTLLLVLTKADVLKYVSQFTPEGKLKEISKELFKWLSSNGPLDQEKQKLIKEWFKLTSDFQNLVVHVERTFQKVQYSMVSSLGLDPLIVQEKPTEYRFHLMEPLHPLGVDGFINDVIQLSSIS